MAASDDQSMDSGVRKTPLNADAVTEEARKRAEELKEKANDFFKSKFGPVVDDKLKNWSFYLCLECQTVVVTDTASHCHLPVWPHSPCSLYCSSSLVSHQYLTLD